jgi:hypothetical protein
MEATEKELEKCGILDFLLSSKLIGTDSVGAANLIGREHRLIQRN